MNNFDISSNGDNIEFSCHYDISLANSYFDEWLKGYTDKTVKQINLGGRDNYLYLIGDSDKPYYTKTELQKMSKKTLFDLMYDYDLLSYSAELNDYKKSEYIEDLLNVTILRHYEYLASIKETDSGKYPVYATCGYSQGDYAEYCYIGEMPEGYKDYINHLFWDCPIYIYAQVNEKEFYTDDFMGNGSDCYSWDKGLIEDNISKLDISDYAKNWLIENLPDYPSYL